MTTLFRRVANVFCAVLLAVASVNIIGVAQVSATHVAGHNGTLKVHEKGTASNSESNNPKVCTFNFEGFGFDENQTGTIVISTQPGNVQTLTVPFGPANSVGYAETVYINDGVAGMVLANGQYKAELGNKSKVFDVQCPAQPTVSVQAGPCVPVGTLSGVVSGTVTNVDDETNDKVTYTVTATHQVTGTTTTVTLVDVNDGQSAAYEMTGLAAGAYALTVVGGDATSTSTTFTITECDRPVIAAAPTRTTETCGTANDFYTIPTTTGITYYVDGQPVIAGTYSGAGTVVVTAVANAGYVIDGTATWTFEFSDAPCSITVPVISRPASVDVCGKKNDTISIPTIEGVKFYVGNKEVSGVVKASGDVTVRAEVLPGYQFAPESITSWEYRFTKKPCKITICHATNSRSNPYEKIRVNIKAVDGKGKNDHTHHTGPVFSQDLEPGMKWGDIIPKVADVTEGYNWNAAGKAIWKADCIVEDVEEPKEPKITAAFVCELRGVVVTVRNTGDAAGYAVVNGESVELAPGESKSVVVETEGVDRSADVHVYDQDENVLIDRTVVCQGQGGGGGDDGDTPTPPVVPVVTPVRPLGYTAPAGPMPTEMPQTGANSSAAQLLAMIALAIGTYGATYYLQGRRKLDANS